MKKLFVLLIVVLAISCSKKPIPETTLDKALKSEFPAIQEVMANLKAHEIQIMYTHITKNETGEVTLTDESFQVDTNHYFYPASTVKLPTAVVALEFVDANPKITPQTPYFIDGDTVSHSLEDDLRQIFAVSNDEAYNRLYALLGRDFINKKLREKGVSPVRIAHRIETENASEAKRKALHFLVGTDTITLGGGTDSAIEKISVEKLQKGVGFIKDSLQINEAMDFSEKNYFPVASQQNLMKRLFFPEAFKETERFQLSESSLALLKKSMSTVTRLQGYREIDYWDGYVKFFMFGDDKGRIPSNFKIYNKIGYAYGTLTDTAYIVDTRNDIHFILTATILVNENGIFDDNKYEYENKGVPFLAELGREIYRLEIAKKQSNESNQ